EARTREEDRATDGPGRVVELVERGRALRRLAEPALLLALELVGIERRVTLVVGRAAMEVLRPRAGHDRDRRAGAAAVLGLEVRRLHPDLADRIERRRLVVAAVR